LIRTLSDFRYNIPIIVFSTIDSINDRKKVCGWGVPEANFISKGPAAHEELRSALHRLVQKSNKYLLSRHTLGGVDLVDGMEETERDEMFEPDLSSVFYINGLEIRFSRALFNTFTAIYDLCQRTVERTFTVDEIIAEKGYGNRSEIHDHINRIRARLFETARRNRVYLNVHEIIRTFSFNDEDGRFGYELNADIPTLDEEYLDPWNEDREALALRNKVLLMGKAPAFAEISAVLRNRSFEVTECSDSLANKESLLAFDADVVVISTNAGDPSTHWKSVRAASLDKDVGVLFISDPGLEPMLVNQLVQIGVPLNSLVSTSTPTWLSKFLQAFENERVRVFVGDAPDLSKDHSFPVVEILDGTDFDAGILNLLVDERPIKMNPRDNGVLSKILGQLVASPGKPLSWPEIESRAALPKSPTKNNKKTWPSRLRNNVIAESWVDPMDGNPIERAKLILESSSEGLRLNVTTIDLRISA
jgi:DNA-binding response OmpR family regulator